jgi:hypothetical protein
MAPASAGCYIFVPTRPATCVDRQPSPATSTLAATPVGTYQPLPYLLPALAVKLADGPAAGLRLGRIFSALLCAALVAAGIAALWGGASLSLLGALVAVTPMVLFTASLLNGSGLEVAAAFCFAASLLRLTRDADPPRAAWLSAACGGALLALSRDASPLWLALVALALVPLGARRRFRAHRRAALATAGALLAAIAANRVWEAAYGPHVQLGLANARNTLGEAIREWWHAATDLIGRFGYLEVHVPLGWTLAWFALAAAIVLLALRIGTRRDRIVLATATVAFGALLPIAFWLVQYRHTCFDLQGRQLLPLVVAVPLLAGELIWRRRAAIGARPGARLFALTAVMAGVVQLAAWWTDARRSAVGTRGSLLFLDGAKWAPPGGWLLWVVVAVAGGLSLALAGVAALRRPEA